MTYTGFSHADEATQLVAFLSGDSVARKRFPDMYHKGILKRTPFLMSLQGNDLDTNLAEDVVQCFWLSLLKSTPGVFHTDGGNADGFIESRLLTAIRDVRATYTPPGQRTRLPKKMSDAAKKPQPASVSFDAPLPGAKNGETLADVYEDSQNKMEEADNRISTDQIFELVQATVPIAVYQALFLIAEDGLSFSKAAQAANLHHTSLHRSLEAWHQRYHVSPLA